MIKTYSRLFTLWVVFAIIYTHTISAQEITDQTEKQKEDVRGMVNFYEYMLNTVGAKNTISRDKEVIINNSYLKIFDSNNVQIEDDLLAQRSAIVNKDVTAYLRDVDFFFNDIQFTFSEITIEPKEANGETYFLASFNSKIEGATLEGEQFVRQSPRFIEFNLNKSNSEFKIASIYTTKVTREEELREWWAGLSYGWTKILLPRNYSDESISNEMLVKLASVDSLDLSSNAMILDIKPLAALKDLKYLNLKDTKILDISALRGARNLRSLNLAGTNIRDIDVVNYFGNLEVLDISNSIVNDVSAIARLEKLQVLRASGSGISSFTPISNLQALRELDLSKTSFSETGTLALLKNLQLLDISRTGVSSLDGILNLSKLESIDFSETLVTNTQALANLSNLREVSMNRTRVEILEPLSKLKSLQKVSADYAGVTEKVASDFMTKNKGVVVITNSEKVLSWWDELPIEWKNLFKKQMAIEKPTKTDLTRLLNSDSLDISGNSLLSGSPLTKFKRLEYLNISRNLFVNLDFLKNMPELKVLNANYLPIDNLQALGANKNLERLYLKACIIKEIDPLIGLNRLKLLDISETQVKQERIKEFLAATEGAVVIYETEDLKIWYEQLTPNWKNVFNVSVIDAYHLHALVQSKKAVITDIPVTSLIPLQRFNVLREVEISNVNISSLEELTIHEGLTSLVFRNSPLASLDYIDRFRKLQILDISNTAVDDLRPLSDLTELEELNFSGTAIKKLKGLEASKKLLKLNISNTRVWQLDRLYDIRTLNTLTCYNTRIRTNEIAEFKSNFPSCELTYY